MDLLLIDRLNREPCELTAEDERLAADRPSRWPLPGEERESPDRRATDRRGEEARR